MKAPKVIWLVESPTAFWFSREELHDLPDDVTVTKMMAVQQLTDEMVVAAARVLNDRQAEACGVDKDDQWKFYSDDFKADARAMLVAAHGIKVDA